MVTRAFRIRVTLLFSRFRSGAPRALGFFALLIAGAAGFAALAYAPQWISRGDIALRNDYDTVITAAVGIVSGLVAFFAGKGHMNSRMFAPYPYSANQIAAAIWLTGWVSWPMLGVMLWLIVRAALRPEWWAAPWAVILGSVATFVAIFTVVRVNSGLSRLLFANGTGAAMRRVVGALVALTALPLLIFGGTLVLRGDDSALRDAVRVLAWFPEATATQAIIETAQGQLPQAAFHFGAMIAAVAVLVGLWFSLTVVSVTSIPKPDRIRLARSGLGWFEYFGDRPAGAVAARTLTYWRRDPRYRVGLWAVPVAPVLMLVALAVAGVEWQVMALLPLPVLLFLLGWSIHNDVAMDSTAIWLHVTSGIRGRDDRLGRLAPITLIGVPLLLLGSSITTTIIGDWRIFPAVLGFDAAVFMIAAAVSSVASARWPYPSTRPGDSPFLQPQWSGTGSGFAQTVSLLLAVALSVPALLTALHALQNPDDFGAVITAAVVGVGSGLLLLWLGVLLGGRVFDRSGPELVAVTEVYD